MSHSKRPKGWLARIFGLSLGVSQINGLRSILQMNLQRNRFAGLVAGAIGCVLLQSCASLPDVSEVEDGLRVLQFHPNMYVVQVGDSFESVARRYEFDVAELRALNPGSGGELFAGQRINVRPGTELHADIRNRSGTGWLLGREDRREDVKGSRSAAYDRDRQLRRAGESAASRDRSDVVISAANERQLIGQSVLVRPSGQSAGPMLTEEIIADDLDLGQPTVREKIPLTTARNTSTTLDTNTATSNNGWRWPASGAIVREYAPDQVNGQGVDIAGVPGQVIMAAADGSVVYTGRDLSNSGNLVIVRHKDGLLTTYSHANDLYVAEDDTVRAGDPIASLGWNSERESVLHFEVRKDGKPVDPGRYLPAR